MYLKSLELSGFKSFAKKATLDFTSAITGIVGPNGSGKSNVAEAFRFVLGEQSIKSLRGKRGEDMIWNGGGGDSGGPGSSSSSSGRANRANVKLTFDNSRRIFPSIDFDEVTIERVVHRDNANEYLLNGSQVRLKDVVEMLAGAHIGATGHHIISQGEADRILSANIRERREMIEDALGLKIYQWKKLESIRKLEKTDENMKQVESLRREIAPHLRFLKKQVEKVEKAEEMRRELITIYKEYFAIEENYVTTEKARLTHELAGPKKELSDLDRALEHSKNILAGSKSKDVKSDAVITLENRIANVRNEKDSVMRELGRLEGEISANKRAIEKEKDKQRREESKTVYLKDVEEMVGTIESFGSLDDAKRLFGEVVRVLKAFISKHRSATDSAMIADAETEITKLSKEKGELDSKLKSLVEDETKLTHEYNDLKLVIEKEKDTNRDAEKDVFRVIARQNEVRNTISDLTNKLNIVLREEEALKHELGEAGIIAGREALDYKGGEGGKAQSASESQSRIDQETRHKQIEKLKIRLEDAGAGGGAEVMKEYRETEERDTFLARELTDLGKAKEELEKLIVDLNVRIDVEFKSGILKINTEFQKYFELMFGGGRAELTVVKEPKRRKKSDLENLGDALSGDMPSGDLGEIGGAGDENQDGPEGLDVNISLPRKKVKGLMMLSGGERALTSIALLFAVSQVNPPPFIILDETDAALDEANSRKYSDMIENLSKQSQLILITHNRETMSRAGVLYGVTMGADGASKLLSIAFEEAVKVAK
ncbi:MAG: AAA family ATPase [Candidatus Taylorbacteria bacterium]